MKSLESMTTDAIAALETDPDLGPVIAEHGPVSIEPADDVFERLVRSIISQQVSTASATAIRGRVYDAVEIDPDSIRSIDTRVLRDAGLSRQKVEYVRNVADAFLANEYDRATFAEMTNGEIIDELTAIKGVGVWTAKMQLIFTFGRPDVFPIEDLGIRNGMRELFDDDITRAAMRERAEEWRPYRSVASLYLWRVVDG